MEVNASDKPQSLAVAFDNYTDPTRPEYDPVFDKQIPPRAPALVRNGLTAIPSIRRSPSPPPDGTENTTVAMHGGTDDPIAFRQALPSERHVCPMCVPTLEGPTSGKEKKMKFHVLIESPPRHSRS